MMEIECPHCGSTKTKKEQNLFTISDKMFNWICMNEKRGFWVESLEDKYGRETNTVMKYKRIDE